MKKKTVKYLIWILFGAITLYFVIFRNGDFSSNFNTAQVIATSYAISAAFVWGVYRHVSKKRSSTYLAAIILYALIFPVMFFTKYAFSPTQMVAIIALFYYSSKIFSYTFKQ